jgi:DNA-binding transcriptional regulator LsrR (DeoR family)
MAGARRARADQYAQRVNAAAKLLAADTDSAEVVRLLARRYHLSERQAWRYVEQARDQGTLEVPRPKVVFTVKLPTDLVRHVRRQAKRSEQTISALVAQALKEFLQHLGARSRDGR